jgi:hypothetical protein
MPIGGNRIGPEELGYFNNLHKTAICTVFAKMSAIFNVTCKCKFTALGCTLYNTV